MPANPPKFTADATKKPRPSQWRLVWPLASDEDAIRRADPAHQQALAESLYLARLDEAIEPYSLQWYLTVEAHRYDRRGHWLVKLLEFPKHAGETVLGLGDGLGTDWLQFAKHGANVICCQSRLSDLALVRRNFELRQVPARFVHASFHHLPLEAESVDVACIHGLLHHCDDPSGVVAEVERVLKPGGKVIAIEPARTYPWLNWMRLTPPPPRSSTFSRRQLRQLFPTFAEHQVFKRHLRRRNYRWACRFLPRPLLERLIGEYLVLRAFKPISAASVFRLRAAG